MCSNHFRVETEKMSIYFSNAKRLLESVNLSDPKISEAKILLGSVSKAGGSTNLINNPTFQNVVNLLTPFVVNYKVNQVLKLLKELAKEKQFGEVDPSTGFKKYI